MSRLPKADALADASRLVASRMACQRRSSRRAVLTAYQRRRRRSRGERMAFSLNGTLDYQLFFVGEAILRRLSLAEQRRHIQQQPVFRTREQQAGQFLDPAQPVIEGVPVDVQRGRGCGPPLVFIET